MVVETIWQEFLKNVKDEAGSRVVDTWFKAITLVKWDHINKNIYLQAPNNFVKEWIKSNYLKLLQLHLSRLLNDNVRSILFINQESQEELESDVSKPIVVSEANRESERLSKILVRQNHFKNNFVNPNYQFNSFVIGPNNSLAYSAAFAITQKPGYLYNPLFIYGVSGLGKTHLLHAIGNQILKDHKNSVVLYQTADRFVNEFINAIRFDKIHLFKEKYRTVDVLLIDDIQFISNKEQTQEAFFHIFNSLYDARKQIVFTSDNYPKDIRGMAERLRSRLEWGLITDIHAPTLETKIAIIKKKLESQKSDVICEDVLYFIAQRAESNIRELEGALIRVLAYANLTNQRVTLDLAEKILGNIPRNIPVIKANYSNIIKIISKNYPYCLTDLQSKEKNKEIALVRQITMYLIKKLTDKSLKDIAEILKRKNHSTVIHAIDKIESLRKKNPDIDSKLKKIEQEINEIK